MPEISPQRRRKKKRYLDALSSLATGASGRPSEYQPFYAIQAEEVAALGATKAQLARVFHVTPKVIMEWTKAHPEFRDAIIRGKVNPDNQVERSLFKRAIGGDVRACIFWLMNRRPNKWSNGTKPPQEPPGDNTTEEQLRSMSSSQLRQLLGQGVVEVPATVQANGNGQH